ncbi:MULTISPECIES: nitrate- and nitrite sensing domain-containing protein [unclassified Streptomyces]|uniref:nitrate- and nitrite sensing domain-containing protein n=1 Tax=unclassified Streptomyces TaxID=2593676 RepID=UPI0022B625F2|nr:MULTISPECIES: nitrate- and nitrite sensing domain-containing protein [unclassified Streptomyces]MCZ7415567.1 nitrate- and nitrite sensing domain-containing protein [Streptomyces sp. WMMC897]MCZ7434621.1 nitrate- and nitrite sensing domain-containing protein [Streptomyces sp. WMMC1477]
MRFRGSTIRRKIVALMLVPLVTLVCIWAYATYYTGSDAKRLLDSSRIMTEIGRPAEETVQAVQEERRQVLVHLADPRRSDALSELAKRQDRTDTAVTRLREQAAAFRGDLSHDSTERLDALLTELGKLPAVRAGVERNTATRESAFASYNSVIDPCHALLVTLHSLHDGKLDREGRALVGLSRARELVAREDALMAAALAAGRITQAELRAVSDRIAERDMTYVNNLAVLPDEERRLFSEYWSGPNGTTLSELEETAVEAGPERALAAVNTERWDAATSAVLDDLERMGDEARDRYTERVEPAAVSVLLQACIAGVLGFCGVLLSVVVSLRIGRRLVRDLGTLRREAHEVSGVRLPAVMRRLAAGDQVDVETEAPRLEYGQDEIGQAGQALNTLQRAAVEAAVKQAELRRGVSEVFVNLARRSQVLLHRQLALLDVMERRTEDPDELADLFRLDHLTTRMRRHAEGLVILSGAAPSRQWRKPVRLMDVVRAAVAEVEDYERIEVRRLSELAVDGPAVADLTHLVAELLENATSFSPPHTAVQVRGQRVANGFTLEIHDRGLGMTPEALLEANLRLTETPEFELSDTDRLGLFVVSRLAKRQGVRVSLQPSPYGGTTAVVLVPGSVLNETDGTEAALEPRRADDGDGRATLTRVPSAPPRDLAAALGLGRGPQRPVGLSGKGRPVELDGPLDLDALDPLDGQAPADTPAHGIGSIYHALSQRHRDSAEPEAERTGPRGDDERTQDRRGRGARTESGPAPAPEAGPQAEAGAEPPAALPRRRPGISGRPVLVSDHGRPVGEPGGHTPPRREEPEGPATVDGLPRRRRQAHLARQLEPGGGEPAEGPPPAEGPRTDPAVDRDADEVRDRMAALQRGWRRGRQHNDGTTPEGDGR